MLTSDDTKIKMDFDMNSIERHDSVILTDDAPEPVYDKKEEKRSFILLPHQEEEEEEKEKEPEKITEKIPEAIKEEKKNNSNLNLFLNLIEQIKSRSFPIINSIFFLLKVTLNSLAGSTKLFGGKNVGERSDLYPSLFTPAGYAFSIWGLIYTFNALFVIVQLPYIISGWKNPLIFNRIGILYPILCLANIIWLFLFCFDQIIASTFVIGLIWVILLVIYIRMKIGYGEEHRTRNVTKDRKMQWWEFLIIQPTFSLYFGWLTCASLANTFLAGVKDPFGFGEAYYACMMITFTTIPAMTLLFWRKDFVYSGVVCWAVTAIFIKNKDKNAIVSTAAAINASLVGLATAVVMIYLFVNLMLNIMRKLIVKYNEKYGTEVTLPFGLTKIEK